MLGAAFFCQYHTHRTIQNYHKTACEWCRRNAVALIVSLHARPGLNVISVVCLLCFRVRLFIVALWSPAGNGLTSWLLFVMSNCEFVAFPLVSCVRYT